MASVNKVIIVGNLGRDPEVRSFPSGDRVANVTVATTDKWKDKQTGEMREATEWHRVVFNGRLAEIVGQQGLPGVCGRQPAYPQMDRPERCREVQHRDSRRPDADAGQPPGYGAAGR